MQFPRLIVSLALAGTLATGAAYAQQAPHPQVEASGQSEHADKVDAPAAPGGVPAFSELDKAGKGSLTRSDIPKDVDALKQLRAHFNEADQDHDGRVNAAEYNAYVNKSTVPKN